MDKRQMIGILTGKPSRHPYPEHMARARSIAAESMVLLKNEARTLPLKPGKIALFGAGAVDTATCGTGSGFVAAPYTVSVEQGLKNSGFTLTSEGWLKRFAAASKAANKKDNSLSMIDRMWSGMRVLIDDLPVTEEELAQASQETDTAIYVLRRNAGENGDRKAEKGDYYLSDIEQANLTSLAEKFARTVVILNTCVVDANFIRDIPGISACLLMGLPGNEAGNALADVLTGKVNPCGKLTDTWAKQYADYPASQTFGSNDGNSMQEDYTEDIFVGYRYFDSFGIEPLFPFGFGMSYTAFSIKAAKVTADWKSFRIQVAVTNTGDFSGRQVVQLYVSAPKGALPKPFQELKAYTKTKLLAPGESETLELYVPVEALSSFDTKKAAFVMEKGTYRFRLGDSSRSTKVIAALSLDDTAVLRQVRNELQPDHDLQTILPPELPEEAIPEDAFRVNLSASDCICVDSSARPVSNRERFRDVVPNFHAALPDVKAGKVSMEEFVSSLEADVLLQLVTGSANETPYQTRPRLIGKRKLVSGPSSSGATTSLFVQSLGIPNLLLTDGPAGCHLPLCGATCYPVGTNLAQTWDADVQEQVGGDMGKELTYYNYSVILGPGMNIHRDPLCGRSFEYFSEDPLLTGKTAAAITGGVQRNPGASVSIKHFACNNQEADRLDTNATVTERALREIYLRGFEICVKEAQPHTIMTSYNKLNGIHTSEHFPLLTNVLRGEWGFEGLVMTDWGTKSDKAADLHAGNDLIMGGYRSDFLKAAVLGTPADFEEDGYVKCRTFKVFGGFFKETIEGWNAFVPQKNGPDCISTIVPVGKSLNEKAAEMVKAGLARQETLSDSSTRITYYGINRRSYLDIDDVRACACRVLTLAMNANLDLERTEARK